MTKLLDKILEEERILKAKLEEEKLLKIAQEATVEGVNEVDPATADQMADQIFDQLFNETLLEALKGQS